MWLRGWRAVTSGNNKKVRLLVASKRQPIVKIANKISTYPHNRQTLRVSTPHYKVNGIPNYNILRSNSVIRREKQVFVSAGWFPPCTPSMLSNIDFNHKTASVFYSVDRIGLLVIFPLFLSLMAFFQANTTFLDKSNILPSACTSFLFIKPHRR